MSCPHCRPSKGSNGPCEAYNTIGKDRAAFFDDGYFDTRKLSVRLKNQSGVEFHHNSEMLSRVNHVQGSISAAYNNPNYTVSLDKFGVKTDGKVSLEAAMRLTKSLKLLVAAEDSRQEPGKPIHSFGRLGFEYKNPMVAFGSDVDIVNGPILRCALVGMFNAFRVGIAGVANAHLDNGFVRSNNLMHKSTSSIGHNSAPSASAASSSSAATVAATASPAIVDVSVALQYRGAGWWAALKTRDYCKSVDLSYIQTLSPDVDVGVQVDYGIRVNAQKLHVGAKMNIDDKSSFKAKLDSNAILAASFTQQLSKVTSMTVCAEINVTNFAADSHKFGLGLTFEQP